METMKRGKTEVRDEGDILEMIERTMTIKVNYSGQGFMAVSCEDGDLRYAGILLQSNGVPGFPSHISPEQLNAWRRTLSNEAVESCDSLNVDGETSSSVDRRTTSTQSIRVMRSVKIRPQIARTLCAKCRIPVLLAPQNATVSKRKQLLPPSASFRDHRLDVNIRKLPSPVPLPVPQQMRNPINGIRQPQNGTTGYPRAIPNMLRRPQGVPMVRPKMTPIVETRTVNGYRFEPMAQRPPPPAMLPPPTRLSNSSTGVMSVRSIQSSDNPNSIPKLRIVIPRVNSPQNATASFSSQNAAASFSSQNAAASLASASASATAVVMTGKPIDPRNDDGMRRPMLPSSSVGAQSNSSPIASNSSSHPPVRIKIGAISYRHMPPSSSSVVDSQAKFPSSPVNSKTKFPSSSAVNSQVKFPSSSVENSQAKFPFSRRPPSLNHQNRPSPSTSSIGRPSTSTSSIGRPPTLNSSPKLPHSRHTVTRVYNLDEEEDSSLTTPSTSEALQVVKTNNPIMAMPTAEENPFGLEMGQIVWAKMRGEPFWPAELFCFNPNAECCVLWFGSSLHGFLPIAALEPFNESFNKRYNVKRMDRGYQKAVADAIVRQRETNDDCQLFESKLSPVALNYLTGKKTQRGGGRRSKGKRRLAIGGKLAVKRAAMVMEPLPVAENVNGVRVEPQDQPNELADNEDTSY